MDTELLKKQYDDVLGRAERLRSTLVTELGQLLNRKQITLGVPIESRVKSWDSIVEKIQRKELDPTGIDALYDLIGVRLILLFRRDLDEANTIVKGTFRVISSENTAERLAETQFGYQSQHYVVSLPDGWFNVPSMADLRLYAEVQVRTVAQHIWAAASHKLQYKHEDSVPLPLRRTIHRVSALLETVDVEFERVLEERQRYAERQRLAAEPLNVENVAEVLTKLLPADNKVDDESYADLLLDLGHFNIETVQQLTQLLTKHKAAMEAANKAEAAKWGNSAMSGHLGDRHKKGIYLGHVGLATAAMEAEFGTPMTVWLKRQGTRRRGPTGGPNVGSSQRP